MRENTWKGQHLGTEPLGPGGFYLELGVDRATLQKAASVPSPGSHIWEPGAETGQAPHWKKRAALSPQWAPYEIRNPSFLRICSEPSRWLLWTCQNISVWSHPCFSINKSIFGLLATISECYKRGLPSKVNSPSPPPWATGQRSRSSYSGVLRALSRNPSQGEQAPGCPPLCRGQSLTLAQRVRATAVQDPAGSPSSRQATPIPPSSQSVSQSTRTSYSPALVQAPHRQERCSLWPRGTQALLGDRCGRW